MEALSIILNFIGVVGISPGNVYVPELGLYILYIISAGLPSSAACFAETLT